MIYRERDVLCKFFAVYFNLNKRLDILSKKRRDGVALFRQALRYKDDLRRSGNTVSHSSRGRSFGRSTECLSFSHSRIVREQAFFSQHHAAFAKRTRICANSFCAVRVGSSCDHSNEISETSHRAHSICQQVISPSLSLSFFRGHRKKQQQRRHRYRISRGGTVIPATKITQVDYPAVIPTPSVAPLSLLQRILGCSGREGATRFYWRNKDRTRRSVGRGISLSHHRESRADFFRRARFQFSRTPLYRPSARRSCSCSRSRARHFGKQR